jgi:hypothetical protein
VSEYKVLRRILGPKEGKVTERCRKLDRALHETVLG